MNNRHVPFLETLANRDCEVFRWPEIVRLYGLISHRIEMLGRAAHRHKKPIAVALSLGLHVLFLLFLLVRAPAGFAGGGFNVQGTDAGDGTHDVKIAFENPITQTVDPQNRTITNVTDRAHWFYPGTVKITVMQRGEGVTMHIVGEGIGGNRILNMAIGPLGFLCACG